MDIYDIIIEPPYSSFNIIFDNDLYGFIIICLSLFTTALIAIYYRRFIAICSLNYITALLNQRIITYKHYAYLLAQILCYRHRATYISKIEPPLKSSKKKHYLWIDLVDTLNSVRYGKDIFLKQPYKKLHKTALEWLRQS